jgi:hypothetical protein
MSANTPTMVHHSPFSSTVLPIWNRLPTASSFGQKRFAMLSLISTTAGAPTLSCLVNSRPARNGIPSVRRMFGQATL